MIIPYHQMEELLVLKGNLAPDGGIVKIAGLKKLQFTGKARCFDNEEAAMACCAK